MNLPAADVLLAEADRLLYPKAAPIIATGWSDRDLTLAAFAIRFKALSPSVHLRALVEGWDFDRCVREVNS